MSEEEINARIARLSPQARALFSEVHDRGKECDFHAPPLEVLEDELLSRIKGLPVEEQREFFGIFGAIARDLHEEALRMQAEAIEAEGFIKLIARAQELDRQAGRPVNEHMTLEEAIPKLEAAGKLDSLEREYVESVKDEVVWVPVPEQEDQ
jgi:hypothetical protein